MLMNINAIHVCKLIDICAIIYDSLYWIKKTNKKKYNLWFCFIYIQLNGQKMPSSECTDATHDAWVLVHLVKPSKKNYFNSVKDSL